MHLIIFPLSVLLEMYLCIIYVDETAKSRKNHFFFFLFCSPHLVDTFSVLFCFMCAEKICIYVCVDTYIFNREKVLLDMNDLFRII